MGIVTFIFVFAISSPVLAEEGETPQLVLSVLEASPGATIEVTGGHFEPDVLVTFILFRNGTQIQLGTVFADYHGDFTAAVLLPLDLQLGRSEFRAVDEKGHGAIAALTIVPDPSGLEGGEAREEEDPLLAPMPTYAPGVVPGGVVQATAQPTPREAPGSNRDATIFVGFVLAVGILVVIGLRVSRKI